MNSCSSAASGHAGWRSEWKGGCGGKMRWKPIEIAALVLGFAIYWPIGLAILGLKFAQRRGYTLEDAMTAVRAKFAGFGPQAEQGSQWRPFSSGTSGNAAFDDWRKAEMERLEQERQKLDAAQREFADYMDNLRRAKDREEFDRFMNERNAKTSGANPA